MKITTYSREGFDNKLFILSNGEIKKQVYGGKIISLGNFLSGTCWKGEAVPVVTVKELLDKWGVNYNLPALFRLRGEYNPSADWLLVVELSPAEKEEEIKVTRKGYTLQVEWTAPFMELTEEVVQAIYKMTPKK